MCSDSASFFLPQYKHEKEKGKINKPSFFVPSTKAINGAWLGSVIYILNGLKTEIQSS